MAHWSHRSTTVQQESQLEPALTSPISPLSRLKLTDTHPKENTAASHSSSFVHAWAFDRRVQKNVSNGYWLSAITMVMEATTISKSDLLAHNVSSNHCADPDQSRHYLNYKVMPFTQSSNHLSVFHLPAPSKKLLKCPLLLTFSLVDIHARGCPGNPYSRFPIFLIRLLIVSVAPKMSRLNCIAQWKRS